MVDTLTDLSVEVPIVSSISAYETVTDRREWKNNRSLDPTTLSITPLILPLVLKLIFVFIMF